MEALKWDQVDLLLQSYITFFHYFSLLLLQLRRCKRSVSIELTINRLVLIYLQGRGIHLEWSGSVETVVPFSHTRPNAAE